MENCTSIYWNGSYGIFACTPCQNSKSCATILALENMKFCVNSCSLGPSENLFDVNGKETNGSEIDEILNFTATLKSYGKLHNFNASNATAIASNLSNLNTSVLNTSVLNTSVLYEGQNQTISSTAHAFFEEGWDNSFEYIVMLILILSLLGLFAAIKYFKQTLLISRRRSISSVLPLPDIESMTHGTHDPISTSDMVIQNVIDDLIYRISDTNIESLKHSQNSEQPSAIQKLRKQKKDRMRRRSMIDCIASEENLRKNIVKSTLYSAIDHVVRNLELEEFNKTQHTATDDMSQARALALLRLRKRHLIRQRKRHGLSQNRTDGMEYAAKHLLLRNRRHNPAMPQPINVTTNQNSAIGAYRTGNKRNMKIRELFQSAPSGGSAKT